MSNDNVGDFQLTLTLQQVNNTVFRGVGIKGGPSLISAIKVEIKSDTVGQQLERLGLDWLVVYLQSVEVVVVFLITRIILLTLT